MTGDSAADVDYLPTLDGWRAIAILLVLSCHGGLFYFSPVGPRPCAPLERLVSFGWVGVDIFFAISGFLICTLLLREQHKTGRIDLRAFYIRRAFRILPPYFLYLIAVGTLAAMGAIAVGDKELQSCLFFFRNYIPVTKTQQPGWYTGHFWSLAIEEHFYLLWPGLLFMSGRRRAARAALAMIAAITIWRSIDLPYINGLFAGIVFDHRTDVRLDSLLWGCVFAFIFASETGRTRLKKWSQPRVLYAGIALLLLCIANRNALSAVLRPPLFAAIVAATVAHPRWAISKVLENSLFRWIGRLSYSLYIWQQLFMVWQLIPRPLPLGVWQEVPLSFVCILFCATASHYFVERPMIRWGRQLSRAQSASSIPSSSSMGVIVLAGSSA